MDIRAYSTTAASNTADFPEGMAPSAINDEGRELQAEIAQLLTDQSGTLTTAGTSTAYTLTLSTTPTSLADGLKFSCTFDEANTGNSTLVVTPSGGSAFASKKIKKFVGSAEVEIVPGDVGANAHHDLEYDSAADGGSGAYILKNPMYPQAIAHIVPTAALAQADVTWPSSIPALRVTGTIFPATTTVGGAAMRISTDNGTTYKSGASDYVRGAHWHAGATPSSSSAISENVALLTFGQDSTSLPIHIAATVHKGTGSQFPSWRANGSSFSTVSGSQNISVAGYMGAQTDVATNLRFLLSSGGNMTTNTRILVEAI